MTSSEDVLLQVGQVRYKKGDGTLYLMTERLAWILEHKDTVSVSHRYADIKLQKISPEGKPKIQLQVVLHDNTTSTFQFVNREGTGASIRERDKVKDLLVTLLPKFKRKVNKELEEKNKILSENPGLLQLYKDLVMTEVVTSEEFWSNHAKPYMNKVDASKQQVGVTGAFLADIKPQTDGCNGLKYNLTPDIMESVFRTYPAVRQKHKETVPHKLSEAQFWTKFFQSHYFHRDRINTGSKDLFTDCAKIDDQVLTKETENVSDPLVDISKFEDVNLGEGYGSLSDKPASQNIVHQSMIKRFNQHSIMVLKACQSQQESISGNDPSLPNNGTLMNGNCPGMKDEKLNQPVTKKARIQEKITYEDLDENSEVLKHHSPIKLSLSRVKLLALNPSIKPYTSSKGMERYLEGPVKRDWAGTCESEAPSRQDIMHAASRLREEAKAWPLHYPHPGVLQPATAVAALGELTPGGALMVHQHDESLAQLVSPSLAKELRSLYCTCCELLRHFWACFPPTSPELQNKAEQMHNAIRRFHHARIKPFENKVMLEFSPLSQQLTSHLNQLLKTAYSKYDTWQSRRKPLGIR